MRHVYAVELGGVGATRVGGGGLGRAESWSQNSPIAQLDQERGESQNPRPSQRTRRMGHPDAGKIR
jgi:hypothetical protein